MGRFLAIAAVVVGLYSLLRPAAADPVDVGAMAEVQRTVYGVPPQGTQTVKRIGDKVVFQETLEALEHSSALVRFIDDSKLTIGAKSKVLIDAFVFDPEKAAGNALIRISVGTLRFVTGGMPKGGTVIKTPTATLILRGTDVSVHVHPDGTTDAAVHDGIVDAHNDVTGDDSNLAPGEGATLGNDGNSGFDDTNAPTDSGFGDDDENSPEHRRAGSPETPAHNTQPPSGGGSVGRGPN